MLIKNHKSRVRSRLWTKVHQINYACSRVIVACNAVFRLTISRSSLETFAITSRSCLKSCRKSDVFGPPNFWGRDPKFLTQFYKSGSPSNVANFGENPLSDSEIRRRKKKKERKEETLRAKHNGRRPASSSRTAIIMIICP